MNKYIGWLFVTLQVWLGWIPGLPLFVYKLAFFWPKGENTGTPAGAFRAAWKMRKLSDEEFVAWWDDIVAQKAVGL